MPIDRIAVVARECSQNNKINEVIDVVNNVAVGADPWSGWAVYSDTSTSIGSPQVITQGTTARILNNAGASQIDQLPIGATSFYDGTKIIAQADGDAYDLRISINASSTNNDGAFVIKLDISPTGNGSNIVTSNAIRHLRGAGNYQLYSVALPIFTRATFLTNGGRILLESITGNTSIYGASFLLVRTHKAR